MQIIGMTISGYVVGTIWMPAVECYKPLSYDVLDQEARWSEPGTLREHVLRATNDGDFQSCEIADGVLSITVANNKGAHTYTRTRHFPLEMFPSIKDCINTDWCGPDVEG